MMTESLNWALMCHSAVMARDKYDIQHHIKDLDKAIQCFEEALYLCPLEHPFERDILQELAMVFIQRYQTQEIINDIEEAIEYHRRALKLTSSIERILFAK